MVVILEGTEECERKSIDKTSGGEIATLQEEEMIVDHSFQEVEIFVELNEVVDHMHPRSIETTIRKEDNGVKQGEASNQ